MTRRGRIVILAAALVAAACSGEAGTTTTGSPSPAYAAEWQQTVDDLRDLQDAQGLPDGLVEGDAPFDPPFDVNDYFTEVFGHIEPEPSFVLDYVYRVTPDRGYPVLYIRRADTAGYTDYEAYLADTGGAPAPQGDLGYLDQIYVIDGTPTGFFEYVVLRIMGGQFYLHWHAQQDDAVVVATREALDEELSAVGSMMSDTELQKAREADPTPVVTYGDGTVTVEVSVLTHDRDLERHTYVFEEMFPQMLVDRTIRVVATCSCGVPF